MTKVDMVLENVTSGELDRVSVEVRDPEDCSREILAALTRARWVLSVGDCIKVE